MSLHEEDLSIEVVNAWIESTDYQHDGEDMVEEFMGAFDVPVVDVLWGYLRDIEATEYAAAYALRLAVAEAFKGWSP